MLREGHGLREGHRPFTAMAKRRHFVCFCTFMASRSGGNNLNNYIHADPGFLLAMYLISSPSAVQSECYWKEKQQSRRESTSFHNCKLVFWSSLDALLSHENWAVTWLLRWPALSRHMAQQQHTFQCSALRFVLLFQPAASVSSFFSSPLLRPAA